MQRLGLWVLCSGNYRDNLPPSTASWPPLQPGRHRGRPALAPCPGCRTAHPLPGPEGAGDPLARVLQQPPQQDALCVIPPKPSLLPGFPASQNVSIPVRSVADKAC